MHPWRMFCHKVDTNVTDKVLQSPYGTYYMQYILLFQRATPLREGKHQWQNFTIVLSL